MASNGYPRWDEDGLRVAGAFVRVDEAPTEYGRKPIVVLDVDGEERSVWLTQDAVRSKFRDELADTEARLAQIG